MLIIVSFFQIADDKRSLIFYFLVFVLANSSCLFLECVFVCVCIWMTWPVFALAANIRGLLCNRTRCRYLSHVTVTSCLYVRQQPRACQYQLVLTLYPVFWNTDAHNQQRGVNTAIVFYPRSLQDSFLDIIEGLKLWQPFLQTQSIIAQLTLKSFLSFFFLTKLRL